MINFDTRHRGPCRTRQGGSILLELACGAMFLTTLLMLAVDITLMMLAYQLNERTCKEACRAAAQQRTADGALAAARSAIAVNKGDRIFIADPVLNAGSFRYQDNGGDLSAGEPYVTVVTQVDVKLPIPIVFFDQHLSLLNTFTLRKQYTYPIIDINLML